MAPCAAHTGLQAMYAPSTSGSWARHGASFIAESIGVRTFVLPKYQPNGLRRQDHVLRVSAATIVDLPTWQQLSAGAGASVLEVGLLDGHVNVI